MCEFGGTPCFLDFLKGVASTIMPFEELGRATHKCTILELLVC
jgi:hypothetical protein